ncbi:EVE domain-containing protein [Alphaproteobacteria bacterium]|nr:EVE domain-containing protein [Alphaproteobacteria bacterium]
MNYWLLKSEPSTWSWSDQKKVKNEMWDGVRNYQARNNLMKMKKGDLCFFYHSVNEKKIVGIVKVVKEYYIDPTDEDKKFVAVDVTAIKQLKNPVTLEKIKATKSLNHLSLIKQSRLSVMPIDVKSWKKINTFSNQNV